ITEKTVQRATYLQKYSLPKYQELARIRNGVEGIPSVLRRKHHVDQMPVRGYLRSKMWFGFKITAINVKRVLNKVRQNRFLPDILTKIQGFWETMCSTQHFIRLCA
ncbi:MAG: transposase, partial [Bacillota bacterium]|nr:transposase [Bacillota bacterium]